MKASFLKENKNIPLKKRSNFLSEYRIMTSSNPQGDNLGIATKKPELKRWESAEVNPVSEKGTALFTPALEIKGKASALRDNLIEGISLRDLANWDYPNEQALRDAGILKKNETLDISGWQYTSGVNVPQGQNTIGIPTSRVGLYKDPENTKVTIVHKTRPMTEVESGLMGTGNFNTLYGQILNTINQPVVDIKGFSLSLPDIASIGLLAYGGKTAIQGSGRPIFNRTIAKGAIQNEAFKKGKSLTSEEIDELVFYVENYAKPSSLNKWVNQKFGQALQGELGGGKPLVPKKSNLPIVPQSGQAALQKVTNIVPPAVQSISNIAKEPWQMTKSEWFDYKFKKLPKYAQRGITNSEKGFASIEEIRKQTDSEHKAEIKKAIETNQPVPHEVLKDYPDLQGVTNKGSNVTDAMKTEIARLQAKNPSNPESVEDYKRIIDNWPEGYAKQVYDEYVKVGKIKPSTSVQPSNITPKEQGQTPDEKFLTDRINSDTVSAYSTTLFTESQKKLLNTWVKQGKVVKQEQPSWSGPGNRFRYYWAANEQVQPASQPVQSTPEALQGQSGNIPPVNPINQPASVSPIIEEEVVSPELEQSAVNRLNQVDLEESVALQTQAGEPPKPPKDWDKVGGQLWDRFNKSSPEPTPTVRPTVKEELTSWYRGAEKLFTDEFARLNKLGWEAEVNSAMVKAAPGRAAELYRQTMTNVIKSLKGDSTLIKYVDDYLMLHHQLEVIKATGRKTFALVKDGKVTRFTDKQIQLLFARMKAILGEEKYAQVKKAASYIPNVYHELLRESEEVTPQVAEMLIQRYPWYNPIIYEQEDGQVVTNLSKLSPKMIKELSEYNIDKQLVTPLMSLPTSILRRMKANAKNDARKAIANNSIISKEYGSKVEIVTEKPEGAFIDFYENGQRKYLKLGKGAEWIAKDIELFDSQPKDAVRQIANAVNKVSRAAFTTFSPAFIVSNTIFDTITAWFREGLYPWDLGRSAYHTVLDIFTEDPLVNKFRSAGADVGGFFYDEAKMKSEFIKAKKNGNIVIRDPKSALELLKRYSNPFMIIRDLGHAGENAPRLATYRKALKEGLSENEAALRGRRVTVDFARMSTVSKVINDFYLFFNVGVQGFLLPGRTLRDNPKSILRLALFISAVVGLTAYNQTYDEYKDVPDNLKYGSLLIMLPNDKYDKYGKKIPKYITIVPTLREFSLFTGPVVYLMGLLDTKQPELYSSVSESFGYWYPSWSPLSQITGTHGGFQLPTQLGQTMQELITNQDTYRNRPIVDEEMAQLPVKEQYDQYTSKLAITIGQAVNISPKKFDFFINNTFGSLGRDAMTMISNFIDKVDGEQADPRIVDLVHQLREIPTQFSPDKITLEREKFLDALSVEDRTLVLNMEKLPEDKIPFISVIIDRLLKNRGGQVYQTAKTKAREGGTELPDKALEALQASAVANAENLNSNKITKEQYDKERTRYKAYYSGARTAEWRQAQLTGAVATSDVDKYMPEGWQRGEEEQALSAYYEIRDKYISQTEVLDSKAWDLIEQSTLTELKEKYPESAIQYALLHKDDWILDLPEPARTLEQERLKGIEDGTWWNNYRGNTSTTLTKPKNFINDYSKNYLPKRKDFSK